MIYFKIENERQLNNFIKTAERSRESWWYIDYGFPLYINSKGDGWYGSKKCKLPVDHSLNISTKFCKQEILW